eukprot:107025-Rhodomonas_salina.1
MEGASLIAKMGGRGEKEVWTELERRRGRRKEGREGGGRQRGLKGGREDKGERRSERWMEGGS